MPWPHDFIATPDTTAMWLGLAVAVGFDVLFIAGLILVWQYVRRLARRFDAASRNQAAELERFRLLAENSTDVILRLDAADTVVWVSPSVTKVLGWNVADCIGRSGIDFLASEETRQQYRRDKTRVFAGEETVSRLQVRCATGEVRWMEAHWGPFRTPNGRIDGIVTAMRMIDAEVRAEQALERWARIDELTQLFNRRELMDRLAGLIESGERGLAILWCDIDHFKAINDIHGHAAGDAVLRALGNRIRGCLPKPDDLGGRIGGDELMVVLRGAHDLAEASLAADRLLAAAAQPIPFADGELAVTISIGATLALPDESVDAVLARADDAMYLAKERGRNQAVTIAKETAASSG